MNNTTNKIKLFLNKYLIFFLIVFSLLTLLPYVSAFKPLQAGYSSGIVYRGILFSVFGLFFCFILIVYKAKLPIYLWIITAIYLISQFITIFVSPILKEINIPILITSIGLAQTIIISISVITYLTIFKATEFDKKVIDIACLFMIGLGLVLCLYSYIFEYEDIYHTFNTEYGWNYDVTSVFFMKTEYGFILFICSIFSIFYILSNKKYWMYIVPVFFLINMFISRSKTSILCTSIILVSLFVIHLTAYWNKYKKIFISSFIFLGIIIITLMVLTILKIGWFANFNYYITEVIIGDAAVVLKDRMHKWYLLLKTIDNPFNVIFGYGERITPYVLSDCGCATIGDNIYLSNYGVGGIIKTILYTLVAIYVIVSSWKNGHSTSNKIIVLVLQLSFMIGGLFEDDSIIGTTMNGLFSSIVFYSCNKIIKVDIENDQIS